MYNRLAYKVLNSRIVYSCYLKFPVLIIIFIDPDCNFIHAHILDNLSTYLVFRR